MDIRFFQVWFIGLLIGLLPAFSLFFFELSIILAIALFCFIPRGGILCAGLSGLFWGIAHNPPSAVLEESNVRVLGRGLILGPGSLALGKSLDGKVVSFASNAEVGALGFLKWIPKRPNLFDNSTQQMRFHGFFTSRLAVLRSWALSFRMVLLGQISSLPASHQGWTRAFLLGDLGALDGDTQESFRDLGALHFLVISGLHLSMLAGIFIFILGFPLRFLAAGLLISPLNRWRAHVCLQILAMLCVLLYSCMLNFSPGVQRALIFFLLERSALIFWGKVPAQHFYLQALCLQGLLFPLTMISRGVLMSWASYLVLVGLGGGLIRTCVSQVILLSLGAGLYGYLSFFGLFSSWLLMPLMPALLVLLILPLCFSGYVAEMALLGQEGFFASINWVCCNMPREYLCFDISDQKMLCFCLACGSAIVAFAMYRGLGSKRTF